MENLDFQIVKYKKRKNFEYEVVPNSWVIGTKVYFPKTNMNSMIRDAKTKPDVDNWLSYQMSRIKKTGYENYYDAVTKLDEMLEEYTTDTEGPSVPANNDSQLKTRSTKHSVSHVANRIIQLQMPPVFQKIESKMPNNSKSMEVNQKTSEMFNTTEYLEDDEHVADANSSLCQYQSQGGTQELQYLVLEDVPARSSIPTTPVSDNFGTQLSEQPNFTSGETFIIGQLKQLSSALMDLTNAVNMIMSCIENPTNNYNNKKESSSKILTGEKIIQNEADLIQFEEQTDERKKQLRLELLMRIGKRQPTDVRSCCLELCDLLICHTFWQYTSWAGGTKDENKPKFALQRHHLFLNFFKDIVREATDASFSDKEFAGFFQTKMKNRNQLPTKLKRAASRKRNPKKKRFETASDIDDDGDVDNQEVEYLGNEFQYIKSSQ